MPNLASENHFPTFFLSFRVIKDAQIDAFVKYLVSSVYIEVISRKKMYKIQKRKKNTYCILNWIFKKFSGRPTPQPLLPILRHRQWVHSVRIFSIDPFGKSIFFYELLYHRSGRKPFKATEKCDLREIEQVMKKWVQICLIILFGNTGGYILL